VSYMSSWLAYSAGAGTMLLLSAAVSFNTTQCKMEKAQRTRSERTIICLIEPAARALANPGICMCVVCVCVTVNCSHVLFVHVLHSLSLCGLLTQEHLVNQFFNRFTHSPKTVEPRRIIAISPVQRSLRARVSETCGAHMLLRRAHTLTHTLSHSHVSWTTIPAHVFDPVVERAAKPAREARQLLVIIIPPSPRRVVVGFL